MANLFNPFWNSPGPDVTLPLEMRPIGGLGIHLMREFMDDLSYPPGRMGKNLLRMRKGLRQSPDPVN